MFDLHDEAFYVWRDAGVRDAILVHVDGHHDAEPAVASGLIGIGNYVRAAAAEGIVARMHWVVPDPMWHDAARRAVVERTLAEAQPLSISVGPLDGLPSCAAPVLLDVDVDYFFTIGYARDTTSVRLREPWSWPADLASVLEERCPRRILTTVATSITGCFTPFEWKHLGAELAAALDGVPVDPRLTKAAELYRHALRLQRARDLDGARAAFAAAVTFDSGYRHPFRTPAHVYRHIGRPVEARAWFASALEIDPDDDWARLGMAMLDTAEGQPEAALARLPHRAPEPGALDWWRTRGLALGHLGEVAAAIDCYLQALSLSARGAVPLHMRTTNPDRRLVDPRHWDDHAALAALYTRAGDARLARVHGLIARAALGEPPAGVVGS